MATVPLRSAASCREPELSRSPSANLSSDEPGKYLRIDIAAGQHGDRDLVPHIDFVVHTAPDPLSWTSCWPSTTAATATPPPGSTKIFNSAKAKATAAATSLSLTATPAPTSE